MIEFPMETVIREDTSGKLEVVTRKAFSSWMVSGLMVELYRTVLRQHTLEPSYEGSTLAPLFRIDDLHEKFHSQEPLEASVKHWQLVEQARRGEFHSAHEQANKENS
jgi:hypothetical protein